MLVMRTQKLIDSKCDQLALKLCRRIIQSIRMCSDCHPLRKTVSIVQHQFILQTYCALLYKYKKMDELKSELNAIDIESALKFIEYAHLKYERLIKRELNESDGKRKSNRLIKYVQHVNQFALQYFLVKNLRTGCGDRHSRIVQLMLKMWLIQHHVDADFSAMFAKLVENAANQSLVYACCDTLHRTVSTPHSVC